MLFMQVAPAEQRLQKIYDTATSNLVQKGNHAGFNMADVAHATYRNAFDHMTVADDIGCMSSLMSTL